MRKNYFIVAIIALIVGSCAVGGKYHTPPVKTDAAYRNNPATDTITALKWFDLYKDETLKSLIKTVLDSNRNLLSATARIEVARERAGIVRSNFWPAIGYQGNASASKVGINAEKAGAGSDGNNFSMYGLLSWEIDLFGRVRHANRAAKAQFLAEIENRNGLMIALIAQTA